jgi:hypothetical protein
MRRCTQGCQIFFLAHDTKTAKMYQMNTKFTKWPQNSPNVRIISQLVIKYINIFKSLALQNLSKLGFFGLKINHLATLV